MIHCNTLKFQDESSLRTEKKIRVYLQHSLSWCYANFSKLMPTIHTVWLAQRNESSWVWKDTVVKVHKQGLFCKRHYPIERKKGRFSILIFIGNSCNDQVSFIWKKKITIDDIWLFVYSGLKWNQKWRSEREWEEKKDKQHFAVFVDISEICSSEFKRLIWNTTRRNYNKKL